MSSCNPAVRFAPFLTSHACVSVLKCTSGSSGGSSEASSSARSCGVSIWLSGWRHFPRDPRSNGKPSPEDHRRLRKRQWVASSGTGAQEVETAKQHEIQPHLRAHTPASGATAGSADKLQRTSGSYPEARSPSAPTHACMSANTTASPLVRQSRSERCLCRFKPRSTRTAQKQVHANHP